MIDYSKISKHDKELLRAARDAMFCTDIDEDLAEDSEVKEYLHGRAVFLHHQEEAWAGIL